jgi:hypothetical protein
LRDLFSKPGSATVVDAGTGRPLGGVVVAAGWHYIDIRTGEFAGVLFMTDAVTDEHREFVLPSWGPLGITMGNSAASRARWIMPSPFSGAGRRLVEPRRCSVDASGEIKGDHH